MIIGFCGASHLGLCYLAAAIKKNNQIICFDFNLKKIKDLNNTKIDIDEPKLEKILLKNKHSCTFTDDISELSKCDFVYYSYDVKTNKTGESDILTIKNHLSTLIKNLKSSIPLIILSQVNPGFTRKFSLIKKNIYYQVETLIFGKAIDRALYPERFIIGCKTSKSKLTKKFKDFLESFNCPILIMKYESAELSKISINCYLASSVTLTNTLAEVSKSIGASWEEIIPTLKLDKRIGKYAYLKPGLGISGGNIERDLSSITKIAKNKFLNVDFIKTIIKTSKYNKKWLYKNTFLISKKKLYNKISILGLSYKENTNSIKNSPAIELIKGMSKYKIKVYDPLVKNIGLENTIETSSAYIALKGSEVLVIATPWDVFKKLSLKKIKFLMKGNVIIDPYKILKKDIAEKLGFDYYFLG